ncbi:unnamed protein product [Pleuronectes platessa]|uniref:Uncharacterized protein n=1 Tax=Pleuronectes platessa TaxID=8262 RepID=A0A9N7THG9_PLEPL|nr:unnamed protein product [Pleuronectes platessa]
MFIRGEGSCSELNWRWTCSLSKETPFVFLQPETPEQQGTQRRTGEGVVREREAAELSKPPFKSGRKGGATSKTQGDPTCFLWRELDPPPKDTRFMGFRF